MLKITFTAEDKFAQLLGVGSNDVMMPRQLLTRADFATLPDSNVNKPALIPYGDLSISASATAPPVLTGTKALGSFWTGADRVMGFGPMTSLCSPPTSATATASSGGTLSAGVPNAQYGVVITAIDTNGNESDPFPYYTDYPSGGGAGSFDGAAAQSPAIPIAYDTVSGTQKLVVTWNAATGPVMKYRCYLGFYYYGFRPTQYIETTALTCTFTANPDDGTPLTTANITPGATVQNFSALWYYAVSAVMGDGETGLSTIGTGIDRLTNRPLRLEWLPVAGATGYRVYKRGVITPYLWRWDVSGQEYFDDDLTNAGATEIDGAPQPTGLVPCVHVGQRASLSGFSWQAFCVAGCAIKSIEAVYFNGVQLDSGYFNTTWAVPGKGTIYGVEFGTNSYVDINGHRYTLLYVRGPDGETAAAASEPAITVTCKGVETAGDGTGTLITDLADQYEHWLRNFALRDRSTIGPWDWTGPMWNDTPNDVDLVDAASFAAVKAVWASRGPGQSPGAWVMGLSDNGNLEVVSVRTVAARLNQSLDVFSGFTRKSQYAVKIINEAIDLSTTPRYTATLGINAGSFRITDDPSMMENKITTRYALIAPKSEWSTMITEDTNAQSVIGETKPYELSLWCVRRLDMASEITRRRLARKKFPYRIVRWASDMGALSVDLGDIVRISHPDGAGADGWTDRAVFIVRHEFDPQRFEIALEALDLDAVIAELAAHVAVLPSGSMALSGAAPSPGNTLLVLGPAGLATITGYAPTVV